MTTFLEAATSYGITSRGSLDAVVARISDGKIVHKNLSSVADAAVDEMCDVYIASGAFTIGTVTKFEGRKKENVREVYGLQFDCDLADFLGIDKETVYAMPQDEIDSYIPRMVDAITEALEYEGIGVSTIIYSGHGILAWVKLASVHNDRVVEIDTALKTIVRRINQRAGFHLVDTQGTDAGSRIVRLVGTLNTKCVEFGQPARRTRILVQNSSYARVPEILALTSETRPTPTTQLIPDHGKVMPNAEAQSIIDVLAPHWQLGQKHALSLAIAGMMAKASVPEPQALAIVEALSAGDNKPWDRAKSVASSYARVRSGAEVRGWFALSEFVPLADAEFVDGVLQQFRESLKPRILMRRGSGEKASNGKDSDRFATSFTIEPMPDICFDWPWIRDYVGLVEPSSEAPSQFHLAVALEIVGATLGRSVCNRYVSRSVYANLFQMLVGAAGRSRKDTAIEFGVDLPARRSHAGKMHTPAYHAITDVGSAQGLIKELSDHPNTLGYITEYQRLSQQAHRQSTANIFSTLNAAWNTPLELQNVTISTSMRAKMPYLSMIAAVQPGILEDEMLPADIQSGFATRWLFIPGVGKDSVLSDPPEVDEPTAYDLYSQILEIVKHYNEGGGETRLFLDDDAKSYWHEWYQADARRPVRNEDEQSMASRLAIHVRKVALIYAALDYAEAIERKHLEPAISYVEWCWKHTQQLMKTWGAGVMNRIETRIENVLLQKGPITRRTLHQQCKSRSWSSREFTQVLDSMLKNGVVVYDPSAHVVGLPEDGA